MLQGGFRTDTAISSKDKLTVQGNMYTGGENNPTEFLLSNTFPNSHIIDAHTNISGGYLQSVWNHAFSPRSDTSLNMSYDTYRRDDILPENRRRCGRLWNSAHTAQKGGKHRSPSRIRSRRKVLKFFSSHDFHALHPAPSNVVLFKANLNPAAEFARSIVLAPGNGAKL
jgi:hypothetical protein